MGVKTGPNWTDPYFASATAGILTRNPNRRNDLHSGSRTLSKKLRQKAPLIHWSDMAQEHRKWEPARFQSLL